MSTMYESCELRKQFREVSAISDDILSYAVEKGWSPKQIESAIIFLSDHLKRQFYCEIEKSQV